MPTDKVAKVTTTSGKTVTIRAVFLEADEHLLLLREGRGYVAALPAPLCKHRHKRMDYAMKCGLEVCRDIAAGLPGEETT